MTSLKLHIKSLFLVSVIALAMSLRAQNTIPDFDFVSGTNVWLTSTNAAGLNNFKGVKMSTANINTNKSDGDFINYFESDNSYSYGVTTESFQKLNDKVTVYGKMNYSYFEGQNMGGSSFIDPYQNAFNIVEYVDSTAGNKVKETYFIAGGFGAKLNKQLHLGFKGEYKNVSYFKTKDLRHTNDLLDLKLHTGLKYQFNNFDWGLSHSYHRNIESIIFDTYGNTSKEYYSLIDYGAFFGTGEAFDASSTGFTNGSSEKPYFNQENELSLQVNLTSRESISFYNELTANIGKGYFGEKGTSSIVFSEHESDTYSYKGIVNINKTASLHQLSLCASINYIENTLNDYSEINDENKGTVVVYGISHKVSNKTKKNFGMKYSGFFQIENNKPLWNIEAELNYFSNYTRAIYYEALTIRKQEINQISSNISSYRNFYKRINSYRIIMSIGYATGSGYAFEDTEGTLPTEGQGVLVTLNDYAFREYEYFTADRIMAQLGCRYTRLINQNKNTIFGELKYKATKAFDTQYIGDYYGSINLNIGYQF